MPLWFQLMEQLIEQLMEHLLVVVLSKLGPELLRGQLVLLLILILLVYN